MATREFKENAKQDFFNQQSQNHQSTIVSIKVRATQIKAALRTLQFAAAFAQFHGTVRAILSRISRSLRGAVRKSKGGLRGLRRSSAVVINHVVSWSFPGTCSGGAIAGRLQRAIPAICDNQPGAQPSPDSDIFAAYGRDGAVGLVRRGGKPADLHRHFARTLYARSLQPDAAISFVS